MLKALWAQRQARPAESEQTELAIDGRELIWRRSARRKRSLALKFDRQGRLIAMTPQWVSAHELRKFVRSRTAWIDQQVAQHEEIEQRKAEERGRYVYLMGERLEVVHVYSARNFVSHVGQTLQIGSRRLPAEEQLHRRLATWSRERAKDELPQRLARLSGETALSPTGWQVKAYTARWGSCRHDGIIQLNWKLIKAPPEIIDYVIVHELCHLRFFDHSADFWRLVARHSPDYQQQRQWLKTHGRLLLAAAY